MTEETKKPRRKRRSKAEIEAEKAAKAAAAAEVEKMEAAGYEHVRLRDEHGHFIKDDPSTPENEAWEWVKKEDNGRFSDPSSFAEEEPAVSADPTVAKKKEKEEYIPLTGLAKLRSKYAQRGIVDRSRGL